MTASPTPERIPPDARLVLDTSILISYLSGAETTSESARWVLEELVATERNQAVISSVSVTELMVGATRVGPAAESAARCFLLTYPGLSIRSVDVLVAADAAAIREETRLPVPDSLVIATAVMTGSTIIVTNDETLAAKANGLRPGIEVVLLSELGA